MTQMFKMCRKKLHYLSPDNITLRKGVNGWSRSCKKCYNERLRLYMSNRRKQQREMQKSQTA